VIFVPSCSWCEVFGILDIYLEKVKNKNIGGDKMKKLLIVFIVVFLLFGCGELAGKYHVNYYGNGSTSGYPPTDNNEYTSGSFATVLDQHTLKRTDHTFAGWNTRQDYSGTYYKEGDTIEIKNFNIFLYAVWN
jgi:hypothetical protein